MDFRISNESRFTENLWKFAGPIGKNDHPDIYWNPHLGQWRTFQPPTYTVTDKGLPGLGSIDLSDGKRVFREISDQWAEMEAKDHNAAAWNPRTLRWVLVFEAGEKNGGTAHLPPELEKKLKEIEATPLSAAEKDSLKEDAIREFYLRHP